MRLRATPGWHRMQMWKWGVPIGPAQDPAPDSHHHSSPDIPTHVHMDLNLASDVELDHAGAGQPCARPEKGKHSTQDERDDNDEPLNLLEYDMTWAIGQVDDMCEPTDAEVQRALAEHYDDENTWDRLEPELVRAAERAELERFRKMGVYEYMARGEAR